MSANATNPSVSSVPSSNAVTHSSVNSIMIGHTFLTLLLPLLIALFYFSTPESRRRPIFILNVIAIILAFTAGVLIDSLAIHSILTPQIPWPASVDIAIGIIGAFQSIVVDLTLLLRLMSVYPISRIGLTRFSLLTSLPILLKIARVINLIIFISVLVKASRGPLGPENIAIVWAAKPYLKIEWSAQVVDNAYASIAFLWTIRDRGNVPGVTSNIHPNKVTFAHRMRTLSRIALSNFIIPSLFSIVQLIVVYRSVNVLIINDIVLVNSMLAVFGVVFATVWAGNIHRREAQDNQWEEASPKSDDSVVKRDPRLFAYPGLETWRVADSPPTLTFGSSGYTYPTEGTGLSTRVGLDSDKGRSRDASIGVGSALPSTEFLEVKVDKVYVTGSSEPSTPSL